LAIVQKELFQQLVFDFISHPPAYWFVLFLKKQFYGSVAQFLRENI
jgi:hypothetical protein